MKCPICKIYYESIHDHFMENHPAEFMQMSERHEETKEDGSDFLVSAFLGAATHSAFLGGLLGGSIAGGLVGDLMGDLGSGNGSGIDLGGSGDIGGGDVSGGGGDFGGGGASGDF